MLNTIFILGGLGLPKTFGFSHTPTEQGINLAAKIYLCYVSWIRIVQLFTVLTGVISKSLKKLSQTCIGLVGTSHMKKNITLGILAISDIRFLSAKFESLKFNFFT